MSERTVAQKLGIKAGTRVWMLEPDRASALGPLPAGAAVVDSAGGADTALVFAESADGARKVMAAHAPVLGALGSFWVAYPKGNRADVNRDTLWPILAEHGFRPIGQVALDETWSALRFRPLAEGEPQFTGGR